MYGKATLSILPGSLVKFLLSQNTGSSGIIGDPVLSVTVIPNQDYEGAGEIALSITCLLCKHEDLSSVPSEFRIHLQRQKRAGHKKPTRYVYAFAISE